VNWLRSKAFGWGASYLTRPREGEASGPPVNPEMLRRTLRRGDVLLVEGNQRVSEVIKFLTQSSWSHAALYLGAPVQGLPESLSAEVASAREAGDRHLLVEAVLGEGVTLSPLSRYDGFNLRICRPVGLRPEDLETIVGKTVGQLGSRYNVRQVFELARYLFPVELIPARFRRKALEATSELTHEVICSSLIAEAFQEVGFPILPNLVDVTPQADTESWSPLRIWRRPYSGLFEHKRTQLITPRDFDLSPYFEVVKLPVDGAEGFDYRRMRWIE
jgi:hypothetical protein